MNLKKIFDATSNLVEKKVRVYDIVWMSDYYDLDLDLPRSTTFTVTLPPEKFEDEHNATLLNLLMDELTRNYECPVDAFNIEVLD